MSLTAKKKKKKKKVIGIIKINFMAEQLCWIVLDCTRVPKKVHKSTVYKYVIYTGVRCWKSLKVHL